MQKFTTVLSMVLSLMVAGCATKDNLTTSGAQVRIVNAQPDSRCQFIGQITGTQSNWFSGNADESLSFRRATNDLRNQAAKMGGNMIYGIETPARSVWGDFIPLDSKVIGNVYHCSN